MHQSNVPQLRFNNFENTFTEKHLSEVGTFKNGINKDAKDFGHGYPIVNLMDIFGKSRLSNIEFGLVNASENDLRAFKIEKGDVLFIRSSVKRTGVGEASVVVDEIDDLTYSGFLIRFRDEYLKLSLNYKRYCFQTPSIRKQILQFATTSANTNINQDSLNKIVLMIPSNHEPEKIASFLTAVDSKIEKLTRKKELLEEYKKGVMQKLFSGEIRFKDENGNDYPDWEEISLGEISNVRDGTHDSPKYISSGRALVTSKNLSKNGELSFDDINYISEEDYESINKRSKVEIGDILFGMIGTIGNPVLVRSDGFAIKNVALINETNNLKNSFLIHFLLSSSIRKQFYKENVGGTQKFIALGVIRKLAIDVPSLQEQEKIALFLSTINSKIENVSSQIEKTQEFKKGLLQQMFV